LFAKNSTKALLTERQGYQVLPVDLKHLELLNFYNIKVCIHKIDLPFTPEEELAFKPQK
jgi:hypothetical protein